MSMQMLRGNLTSLTFLIAAAFSVVAITACSINTPLFEVPYIDHDKWDQGWRLLRQEKYDEAFALAELMIHESPKTVNETRAYVIMEQVYKARGELDKAIKTREKQVELAAERVDLTDEEKTFHKAYVLSRLGKAHAEYGKGLAEARRIWQTVWEDYPGTSGAIFSGYQLASEAEKAEAESMLEDVTAFRRDGKFKAALKTLDEAEDKYPYVLYKGHHRVEWLRKVTREEAGSESHGEEQKMRKECKRLAPGLMRDLFTDMHKANLNAVRDRFPPSGCQKLETDLRRIDELKDEFRILRIQVYKIRVKGIQEDSFVIDCSYAIQNEDTKTGRMKRSKSRFDFHVVKSEKKWRFSHVD